MKHYIFKHLETFPYVARMMCLTTFNFLKLFLPKEHGWRLTWWWCRWHRWYLPTKKKNVISPLKRWSYWMTPPWASKFHGQTALFFFWKFDRHTLHKGSCFLLQKISNKMCKTYWTRIPKTHWLYNILCATSLYRTEESHGALNCIGPQHVPWLNKNVQPQESLGYHAVSKNTFF